MQWRVPEAQEEVFKRHQESKKQEITWAEGLDPASVAEWALERKLVNYSTTAAPIKLDGVEITATDLMHCFFVLYYSSYTQYHHSP